LIPDVRRILERAANPDFEFRSKADMTFAYGQYPLADADIPATATLYQTTNGPVLLAHTRVPLGVLSAPGFVQNHLVSVHETNNDNCYQFYDDTIFRQKNAEHVITSFADFCERCEHGGGNLSDS
jgi:hypothetical protein